MSTVWLVIGIVAFLAVIFWLSWLWDKSTDIEAERNTQILKDEWERRKMERDLSITRAYYKDKK